jgi:hypothetical protein
MKKDQTPDRQLQHELLRKQFCRHVGGEQKHKTQIEKL